ncbi:CDGSH iron-sulfur domain-containing protein [Arthrobacter sp. RIT-PI-e]|uniref:CDGSH iron-sulfur domain-containing protein n=1 Tax=Arthrobacter sp. RIT-PI-e TaxID=1681197 RepID=UPI0009E2B23C|nr:CDGSH iron-sulfur domain-containing protein [Arthrobacter sp. RIT-PI-e]
MSAEHASGADHTQGGERDGADVPQRSLNSGSATPVSVVACANGPLLVRGDFELVGTDGQELPRTRRTVALGRCGASVLKPYCDGSHKLIGFTTDP